jgi:hypothetical protein
MAVRKKFRMQKASFQQKRNLHSCREGANALMYSGIMLNVNGTAAQYVNYIYHCTYCLLVLFVWPREPSLLNILLNTNSK